MFGRIPRLPGEVLFQTVLDDPAVVSYDKYVASLTRDLKEAMIRSMSQRDRFVTLSSTTRK